MKTFIDELLVRYGALLDSKLDQDQAREIRERLNSLRLAHAVLKKIELNESQPDHLPQIAILGPTQAGKSTLVNLLGAGDIAGVSPLAGYTVHAQGFTSAESDAQLDCVFEIFNDFTRTTKDALQATELKTFSVEPVGQRFSDLPPLVIWDSPDFDSIESKGYRSAVLRVAALADVIILMVSKDKYADKAVWDMLSLVRPLKKPMFVCINKLAEQDARVVIDSFSKRFNEAFGTNQSDGSDVPKIIPIPYVKGMDESGSQMDTAIRTELLDELSRMLAQLDRTTQKKGARELINSHWSKWIEPALVEKAAREKWVSAVDLAIQEGLQRYRDGYLDHPQKYDTFNRALAELLTLLEVPGLAAALGKTRSIVTWPVRKLFSMGQNLLENKPGEPVVPTELEDDVLHQCHAHIVTSLSNFILEQQQDNESQRQWWRSTGTAMRAGREVESDQFQQAIDRYQLEFVPEIEAAAQNLYSKLESQPALLNTLRVARVSTDAAAVVLAVKSGGLAATDLVVAPAMLSLTTMLTEGVLGKYMERVKADLKSRQATLVQKNLFEDSVRKWLYELPDSLQDNRLFMLSDEEIEDALNKLKAANL